MLFSKINKIIVLGILILIVPTYGNQSTHLKTRDSQESAVNTPLKDFVVEDEDIIAYILKEDYKNENKCKLKLKEYCEELKVIDQGLNKVHSKVKEICNNVEQKCTDTKAKIEKELEAFKNELNLLKNFINEGNCEKYEEKCILLEDADPANLKENSINLREGCYIFKRENVAEELLLRALGKEAKDDGECKGKMKDVCPVLSRESDELMTFCLNPTSTCPYLKNKLEKVCESLKKKLKDGELVEKCHERLEKCHFYGEACDKPMCDEDKTKCKEKNITYKAPGSDSSPVEPKPSLLTRIGLEDVYKRAEKHGIIIGKAGVDLPRRFGDDLLQDLLLVLSRYEREKEPDKKCKKALGKCDDSKYLDTELEKLCNDGKKQEKCEKMLDVKERCTKLKLNLHLNGLSTEYDEKADSDLLFWRELPILFTKGECTELESECFYLETACKDNEIDQACQNVRAACYKMGQDRMLNRFFQKELKGKLGDLRFDSESLKKCQEYVVENCAKLKDKRYLPKCLYPKELCYALSDNIVVQSRELGVLLDGQRDSPLEKHCLELGEKCDELDRDSYLNSGKCETLKRRCEFFNVTKRFRKEFLKRKDDSLMTQDNCTKALHEKCEALSRRRKNPFKVSCALPGETCKYMVHHTRQDCFYLNANMEIEQIVERIEEEIEKVNEKANETLVEELCTTWGPYCHQFMENCPSTLKKNKIKPDYNCEELDEKCRDTFKKLELEEELSHLLKGSLSNGNQCKEALGKRCTELQNNETFKILLDKCDVNTKGTVCAKLVKKVKERCLTLKDDLEEAKKELKVKKEEYDKLKQEAEKSTKEASLLLSRPRQTVMPSAQNGSASEEVSQPPSAPEKESSPPQQVPAGSSSSDSSSQSQGLPSSPESLPPSSSTGGTPNASDGTTGPSKLGLVKRAYVDGEVSEAEVKAFDATTIALELYLELKEECKALELDCGFREDCPNSKEVCGEIDTLCKEIEPLKDKPYEKITEPCTLLQTTDIWVTSTSIVTSTVTSTSMRRCKPTKCTTDSSKETQKGEEEEEEEEVKPNDGMKIRVPDMIKIMLLGVIVMGMM
ncbi:hypothetical protein T552_00293 [Pneumocystis carinii B80]|uniref:Major surface glycoprotein 2 C-terminal domain-containing protein n=1 Tax=Pneumocystis carinii (strain B80) TaxID=1408658 RepID=A0A0W4ZQD3_PNEC8|nr:hypothetical protein T552_00293 [Pneumocystis carinii B80]KTW30576.1 hypothetical protein T552_00293 [Pneumocystis carinii B80]